VAVIATLVAGIWSANVAERLFGRKDPGAVVIDEVLGMLITLAFLDVTMSAAITGFFLFRLFDVLKPFPAGRLEHLAGGYGVMMDDAMAGIYSHAVLRLLLMFRSEWFV
jgi:phosphatidylglycerophosphatase A